MDYLFYTLAIVILCILSGIFSATETAFSSLSKVKIRSLGESKDMKEKIMSALADNYEKLISTILIGNNIVNIGAATIATIMFSKLFVSNPSLAGIVSTLSSTLLILLFSEVMPKTIAKRNPESVARNTAVFICVLFYIMYPLNFLVGLWQKLVNMIFKKTEETKITDEELITYVDEAQHDGGIDEYEGELIRSAIEFDDLTVRDALTSRVDIEAIDIRMPMDKILEKFESTGYSRMPVYKNNIDSIVGVLNEKDFYKAYLSGAKSIKPVMSKNLILVPLTTKLSDLLRKLQKGKMHMAIVIGEFGGTSGIITLEDIVEELVGEIWDEHDDVVEFSHQISDTEWRVSGDMDLDEFFDLFEVDQDVDDFDAVTVNGFITTKLERVAKVGDVVKFENLVLTVKECDMNRILQVHVKVLPKQEEQEEENILLKGIIGDKDKESEE